MVRNHLTLDSPVSMLAGAGPHYSRKLYALGIESVRDLLFYFPFRWDDFSNLTSISSVKPEEKVTVIGKINTVKTARSFYRRMAITEAIISDNTGSLRVVWYNQPFIERSLAEGEIYRFSGKIRISKSSLFLQSPSFEKTDREHTQAGGLLPVYHVTEGISPRMLRYFIRQVIHLAEELKEYIPENIIQRHDLLPLHLAISRIHFSESMAEVQPARKRLAFDELFIMQLNYQLKKFRWQKNKAIGIPKNIDLIKKILGSLTFALTDDQRLALWEIMNDSEKNMPMNRLLEGDVGSGKTIVAFLSAMNVAKSGFQAAIMAPTEILAKQHFEGILKIAAASGIPVALITNSLSTFFMKRRTKTSKEALIKKIREGQVAIVIGTHALIQKDVAFKNLAMVVVDEQHRFGVEQRAHLIKSAKIIKDGSNTTVPHLLSMTATPIPRTLALTIYGDLDLSIITKLPKGRKKIVTKVIAPSERESVYNFVRNEAKGGRQAFVICPLIEESEVTEAKAAEVEFNRLHKQIFPDLSVGLLHGKMKPKEKSAVMKSFIENKINILVSTSVVEVGVDIPNATIMLIEGAERFGLSQLHQFRGRVGRGSHQSYCFLFTDSPSVKTWKRITFLEQTENGFDLAKKDLELRGPGEFLGSRQSGFSNLVVASLKDIDLIKTAREEAERLVASDPKLDSSPTLKKRMETFGKDTHFE